MKSPLLKALIIGAALSFSHNAFAEPGHDMDGSRWEEMKNLTPAEREAKHKEMRAKWEGMSEAEREAFKAERKAKWDALSKEEKVNLIEERRKAMKERHDEKWESMTADEKIQFTEERMKRKHKGRKHHGDEKRPPRGERD
ncbi:MAG: hypothetical protein MK052_02105 [Alphaproteobacteria bacterium]|nr:hypothetical protein [Alphaproteobacteria bacterium]